MVITYLFSVVKLSTDAVSVALTNNQIEMADKNIKILIVKSLGLLFRARLFPQTGH
ncbi:MAG TPA: hypothetical protein VKA08_02730 [Balneolales bacterium]|nr:hypothetical protein [Balneolales bacterium]